ncbi:MAG: 3-deoxy-7-phosphoheptulonate synthase [Spongiibacteraceae bacterium]|nr:3-deoxy-7-phosphoheptulonate synthase [Spongiibacteraceae bacterium]
MAPLTNTEWVLTVTEHFDTDDLHIAALKPLIPPAVLIEEFPVSDQGSETIAQARKAIEQIMLGKDDRLLVVVGPCSIHDTKAAMEYAAKLKDIRDKLQSQLLIVMRVYFEKPRTTVGWKGLINDPHLDGSFDINCGLKMARCLLRDLADLGLPTGCEFLDTISPQFIADLVSWGAIGARTTESQVHRELTSGLSMPVGFKNGTDGSVQIALDAIGSASNAHHFLSVTKQGMSAIVTTKGNPNCHVILRGSNKGPNYEEQSVSETVAALNNKGLNPYLMVDCSHGNSNKDYTRQPLVASYIAEQVKQGSTAVSGLMIESNLKEGNQKEPIEYGKSITDACISWDTTVDVLETLAQAVDQRRG